MSTPPFDPQPCCGGTAGAQDVNILGIVPVSGTVSVNEPVAVTVPQPLDVNVLNTVSVAEPLDVNVLGTVPVSGNVGITGQPIAVTGTVTAAATGSTTANATLTAATAVADGTTVDYTSARSDVTLFIQVNAVVTSGVVALQASQDGTNWVRIASSGALATGVNQFLTLSGGAFRWFRGSITETVVGGGSVTATLMHA
jgi:hypothetical protein